MDEKDIYISKLENTIKDLTHQIENLTELLKLMQKQKFGSSSEKTLPQEVCGQISLFNEAELEATDKAKEPVIKKKDGYHRKDAKTKREVLIKNLPVEEIICELYPDERTCLRCGKSLVEIGKETVREEIQYIPAQLKIIRYVRLAYGCPRCKQKGNPYIVKALTPTSLMNHSLASPSSVANVMYQKYVNGMPLYRQEKDWEQIGLALSRATMSNWVIRCATDYLMPVVSFLREALLKKEILYCEQTPLQVLKEEGKKPQTKSYMWLYRSGERDGFPIVLYDYQSSRSGDCPSTYLEGFTGYLHTDGYAGYEKVKNITRCGCRAHLRRYFVEAIPDKKSIDTPKTDAEIGRDYCDKLFKIEKELNAPSVSEIEKERFRLEKPVLEGFWSWLNTLTPLKGSRLGKAVTYALNQKKYMENYLLDGRCSLSNNIAENSIRPFTVGRKNWLFSDTPRGAKASAAVYSVVETAKANNLNVYEYLKYLLLYMPDADYRNDPEVMEEMMPWSERVQQECGK